MDRLQIQERTLKVFKKVFGESPKINEHANADTIDKWDSLNHVLLIQELESEFKIQFDLFEIIEIRDVQGLVDYLGKKINI